MARSCDPKKLALWQGRFQRFLDSGLSVARFCAGEHVSESSFYYWRKKLGPRGLRRLARAKDHGARAKVRDVRSEDRDTRAKERGARAKVRDVRSEDRGARAKERDTLAENHEAGAEYHDTRATSRGAFRLVTVVPTTGSVVVRLPGGARIEVDADHLDAIRAVVAETVRVDRGRAAECRVSSDNRNVSSDNRNVSSGNRSLSSGNRNVSSDNQVIRKRGGTVSC